MKIVIIEDNKEFKQITYNSTIQMFIEKDYNYQILSFSEYSDDLSRVIHDKEIKIYIIDLELNGYSGFDICREIREHAYDWNSIIIISSVHNQKENIISLRLGVFTYLSKLYNYEDNLRETLVSAVNILKQSKFLKINRDCEIAINDICYVLKEKNSKYCIIKTFDDEYRIRKPLKELEKNLHLRKIRNYLLINEKNTKVIRNDKVVFENKVEVKYD